VDTGSKISILSESVAADLLLNIADPDFVITVDGIGGPVIAPGFYVDEMTIPSSGGDLVFTQVPCVILNLTGPAGYPLDGSLGNNLLANRDFVFNGAATPPYLDISDAAVSPEIMVTAIRVSSGGSIEVDWLSEPAAPLLELQVASSLLTAATNWTTVATGSLSTITGTISVTNMASHAVYRLAAP
jgi:hypothetical protein